MTVSLSAEVALPLTWGLWRPVVLLPADAARWPGARLEAVLAHELAHVRRRDTATQAIAQLACALYWFNPLVWFAARRLRIERELACDDRVLGLGVRPADYAAQLVQVARAGLAAPRPLAAVAMGRPFGLERRITAILDPRRRRRAPSRAVLVAAGVAAIALAAPLAALAARGAAAGRSDSERASDATGPSVAPGIGGQARTLPNTPAGRRAVVAMLEGMARRQPLQRGPNYIPVPESVKAVFSALTRYGEYTIWRARTVGPRGESFTFSSPRLGITGSVGVGGRPPTRPYLRTRGGGAAPPLKVREVYGQASAGVVRVQAVLKDGSRQDAILRGGWFVFTQDFGHPKVVALIGYDRSGRAIARTPGRVF